ncbi:MAG: hypothetical protein ACI8UO_003158 [Verrucomicrobiales bacterium]
MDAVIRLSIFLSFLALGSAAAESEIDFNRDIRPLLSDRCFACHGPDANERKAGLRIDTKEGALAPLDDEGKVFALVPGKPDDSELFYRIVTDDEDDLMPPADSNLALSDSEKTLIKKWIEDGAEFGNHWSFEPVSKPQPPSPNGLPIDGFVRARLETEGLAPAPQTDYRTLLRRLSFDITGLPPTFEEIEVFENDDPDDAYENFVDRLLASNRYGERMAAEWMDAARYADTSGYQFDWPRTMWRWRDWVIQAYNENLSYDQFITWQIAGDLLPDATIDQRIATGFNRNHPFTIEGGTIDEEYRVSYVADRVTTMGTVFLGLTLECSRCHDHKFDAISQKDFYQLSAFFNNVPERGRIGGKPAAAAPSLKAPSPRQSVELEKIGAELAKLNQQLLTPNPAIDAKQAAWEKSIPESTWTVVKPDSFTSTGGAKLDLLEDSSVLATGPNPGKEIYEIVTSLSKEQLITGVRVEALVHESMTKGGPGRHANGNAVLTNVEIALNDEVLPIASASADYEQPSYPVAHAIDANPQSGWAFHAQFADHAGVFRLAAAREAPAGSKLRVTLKFESQYGGSNFGRVRYAVTDSPEPALGDAQGRLREIAAKPVGERSEKEAEQIRQAFRMANDPAWREAQAQIAKLEASKNGIEAAIPQTMVMQEGPPRETFILERGQYDQHREKVEADTPANLPAFPSDAPRNRLGLAQWMTNQDQPLTARVAMNRLWHQLFGVGIVKTVDDFGSQGEWPSHLELLDWLAAEFIESGWDLKAMIKTIVMSETYRQSSKTTEQMLTRDPENRLLARGPRHRLSAEMVRDNALFIGGLLVEELGGPSAKPYQPVGLWRELSLRPGYMQVYEEDKGKGLYRRSLYTFWKRAAHHPMMSTFDAPTREVCTFSRGATNTPLQALILLHDPQFVEAARGLAARMMAVEADPRAQIDFAFLVTLSRSPEAAELAILLDLYKSELGKLRANPAEIEKLLGVGEAPVPPNVDQAELATCMMVARAILNLSETITKN